MKRFLATLLIMPVFSAASFAAEIRILSAGAVEPGLQAFAQVAKRETGHDLKIQFNTTPQIAQRLAAGETYDIVIAPPDAIATAAKDGKLIADTRIAVGRVGAGVVVRNGTSAPDIASVDALKRTLLAADSVVYNTASSGIYLDKLFEKMGVLEQLKPKTTPIRKGPALRQYIDKEYEAIGKLAKALNLSPQ
jgi:molybdate transport system substrate-binding protein